MALNIRDLVHMCEFSLELNSLGTVRCLSLNTTHLSHANKRLGASGGKSLDFIRWLFGELTRRHVGGCSDEDDPNEGTSFTAEELSSVTDEELEKFAEKLIQKNQYLLNTHKGSDIERSINESACDFFVRASRHYAAEQKAQWERITQPMSKSLFASATVGAMQQSALDAIAEASRYDRYMMERSASIGSAMDFKCVQDIMRAAPNLFRDARLYSDQGSAGAMLEKSIYPNEDMIRGASWELAHSVSTVNAAELEKQKQEMRNLRISHEAMFRLPQAVEATYLLDSYQIGAVAEFVQRHPTKNIPDWRRSLESITTPWLHNVEAARSVTAILELQSMGNALRTTKGFDLELTTALRLDLGDWRDKITFPESVFIDPVARTDFYVTRGFNTALTDFPEAAFHQSLRVADLDGETLDFEPHGTAVWPSADPKEEVGLRRTNKCHDQLQRFERRLRQFIDDAMTAQYGLDWPRKQLDPALYERWKFKKQQAESSGGILTIIEAADFTDYEIIICKKDHWREIFETRFKRKESVRESFQRLQPIRVTAMHARLVTKEDELCLVVEVRRLLSAIK